MLCLVYLFCVVFSLTNYEIWDLKSYSQKTVFLITACIGTFVIIGTLTRQMLTLSYNEHNFIRCSSHKQKECNNVIEPNILYLLLSVFLGIITIALCIYFVFKFGGSGDWATILSNYKIASYSGTASIPSYLDLLIKVLTILCYIYLYIFIYNVVATKKILKNLKYLIPVFLHIVRSICMGTRYNFICVVAAFFYCLYILYQNKYNWRKPLKAKFLIYGAITVLCVYLFFTIFKRAVGRTDNIDPLYYVSIYTSGSVKLLDEYLKNPIGPSTIFGKETFSGMNSFLSSRGIGTYYDINLEMRLVNNYNLGNVYGAIRRYYQDFGYIGCLILVGFSSLVWNLFYYRLTLRKHTKYNDLLFVIFMYMINALIIFPIDDKFYTIFATPTFIEMLLIAFVLWFFIISNSKKRIKCNQPLSVVRDSL